MKLEFYRQILKKYSNINSPENVFSGSRVVTYRRTDRNDEAKFAFCNFAIPPKIFKFV